MLRDEKGRILKGARISPDTEIKKGQHLSSKTEFKKGLKPWNTGLRGYKSPHRGHPSWKKGKRWGEMLTCINCKKTFYAFQSQIKAGRKYCSHKCEAIINAKTRYFNMLKNPMRKENHWNWNGGITSFKKLIRESNEYKKWRYTIFNRDKNICKICNIHAKKQVNADHYPIPFAQILRKYKIRTLEQAKTCGLLWDINNGRTLCIPCHRKTSNYMKPIDNQLI